MSITHINRRGKIYYLHIGKTKTGKNKYFFSTKSIGTLAETIPNGYEIYENPNAQVFLRKVQPKVIMDIEKAIIEEGIRKYSKVKNCKIDIRKETITIYIPDQDIDELTNLFQSISHKSKEGIEKIIEKTLTFSPMLRFTLADKKNRKFIVERYCFLGSIDDWIEIGGLDSLENQIKRFVKHLGQESFYDLME